VVLGKHWVSDGLSHDHRAGGGVSGLSCLHRRSECARLCRRDLSFAAPHHCAHEGLSGRCASPLTTSSLSLAFIKQGKIGTKGRPRRIGRLRIKPLQTSRRIAAIQARRSGSHVVGAAAKADQLQRVDIKPLDHVAHAPGLAFDVAKKLRGHVSTLASRPWPSEESDHDRCQKSEYEPRRNKAQLLRH
jgi:hypothetical protein